MVASLLERIIARRAYLADQAELLGKQLAEVQEELARTAAAEQVVAQLLAEEEAEPTPAGDAVGSVSATADTVEPVRVIPPRREAAGPSDLPPEYRRVLEVGVGTGGAVRCKTVCERLGVGTEPRKVEAMRARLKRLVSRGWLREVTPGLFAPA